MMTLTDSVRELYKTHRQELPVSYRWEDEKERWHELLFCVILEIVGGPAESIRNLVTALAELRLLGIETLASSVTGDSVDLDRPPAATLLTLLTVNGCEPDAARAAIVACCRLARQLRDKHGKLQHLLRAHGQTLLRELATMVEAAAPRSASSERIATIWLQNALEMPVSFSDAYVERFCKERRCTLADLTRAADELDINVATLDDLIRQSYVEAETPKAGAHGRV